MLKNSTIQKASEYRNKGQRLKEEMDRLTSTYGNIWDQSNSSSDIKIFSDCVTFENVSQSNKWRVCIAKLCYSSGWRYFEFKIITNPKTTNTWKIVVGFVHRNFKITHSKIWIGAQNTWGFISGTGGKVRNSGRSSSFASSFGAGDVVGVLLDFNNRSLEFHKNGQLCGEAFQYLSGPVYPAFSVTGQGAKVILDAKAEEKYRDKLILYH